ncbi:MAG: trypsin-like peptidase domain-containing protein [Chloroherpetonaceae bacterium]|nr:trypsin-like peptidase domain-containing protein [Chthonomonadaceae bacterium]MDW8208245.1 trypsin-like peptidase domain-containing protein [Chloroherpetonaceae bacterium]
MNSRPVFISLLLLTACVGFLSGQGCRMQGTLPLPAQNLRREVSVIPVTVDASPNANPGPIAEAAARIEPAVVTIDTAYRPRWQYGMTDFPGVIQEEMIVPRGSGSGVILNPDGYIVTNNHVVEDATRILVTLHDGRRLEGRVLGTDPSTDLAIVKVDQKNLPAAVLADSNNVRVGEWVIAVGNPLGVGTTVTAGIVSAVRKEGKINRSFGPVIQTDAAINRGNSGGALADIKGRLIGINTFILSPNGGNIGIGFAIPSNIVREVVAQLIERGRIARPWLGIGFETLTDFARQYLNIPMEVKGVIVAAVAANSPAAAAGLRELDVIRSVNGKAISTAEDLQTMVQQAKVGDRLVLQVWRNGTELTLTAVLQERPARM